MPQAQLREIARARAGDKGDTSIISVIARSEEGHEWLRDFLTVEKMEAIFAGLVTGSVERFEVAHLGVLHFVLHGALRGGVTRSTNLDRHGKTRSSLLLAHQTEIPQPVIDSALRSLHKRATEEVIERHEASTGA
jgi:hypothetical protein